MTAPIDFSACERLPGRAYNGANGKKIAVRYDGDVWLLKFPPSAAEKPTALSYSNSCYSEHIASNIAKMAAWVKTLKNVPEPKRFGHIEVLKNLPPSWAKLA